MSTFNTESPNNPGPGGVILACFIFLCFIVAMYFAISLFFGCQNDQEPPTARLLETQTDSALGVTNLSPSGIKAVSKRYGDSGIYVVDTLPAILIASFVDSIYHGGRVLEEWELDPEIGCPEDHYECNWYTYHYQSRKNHLAVLFLVCSSEKFDSIRNFVASSPPSGSKVSQIRDGAFNSFLFTIAPQ